MLQVELRRHLNAGIGLLLGALLDWLRVEECLNPMADGVLISKCERYHFMLAARSREKVK